MSTNQQIIDQDNDIIRRLIERLEQTASHLKQAGSMWHDASNTNGTELHETLEAAAALDNAVEQYRIAAADLARQMTAYWKAGYRLCR